MYNVDKLPPGAADEGDSDRTLLIVLIGATVLMIGFLSVAVAIILIRSPAPL